MNEFLATMSTDMGINRYQSESDDSFYFRICYSALGQWCLRTAQNLSDGLVGTTKHNQTIVLNELLQRFSELFPNIANRLSGSKNQKENLSVHIRRVYEETGYLLTNDNNRNQLVNFGRSIKIGNTSLYFGVPNVAYTVNGLGVFSTPTSYKITTQDFLIRDNLTYEEYFQSRFDITDFYERDINIDELEFFNPLSNNVPSLSWSEKMETECTIARKSEMGPYYRVMYETKTSLLFAEEPIEVQSDSLISYEYRRLYYALKAYYGNPLNARILKKDSEYSEIKLGGHLPNREYYYLLLLSWPVNHAFDKVNFLVKNCFVSEVAATLKNIGIDVKGGNANE